MKHIALFIATMAIIIASGCTKQPNEKQEATARVEYAKQLIDNGRLNQAKIELDSVHQLYPKQVDVRRQAKELSDSIIYIEAQRNLVFADSALKELQQKYELLVKQFKYEKNSKYEDVGRFTHIQIYNSIDNNHLEAYITENVEAIVRSYYTGTPQLNHSAIIAQSNGSEVKSNGSLYLMSNKAELTTISGTEAIQLLNFISANQTDKIRIRLEGDKSFVYYINPATINALAQTYELLVVMQDIKNATVLINHSNAVIDKWHNKHLKNML